MAQKRIESFKYAWKGICEAFHTQWNIRIHFICAIIVTGAGYYFRISSLEWIAVSICIGMVFAAELFNTSIEYLVDLVSPEKNPLAGKVKDLAAGGVLITAFISVVVAMLIFLPKILSF